MALGRSMVSESLIGQKLCQPRGDNNTRTTSRTLEMSFFRRWAIFKELHDRSHHGFGRGLHRGRDEGLPDSPDQRAQVQ